MIISIAVIGAIILVILLSLSFYFMGKISGKSVANKETTYDNIKTASTIIKSSESNHSIDISKLDNELREFERKDN